MNLRHLQQVASLLDTDQKTATVEYVRIGKKRGYWLGDTFLGKSRQMAFETLLDMIRERMRRQIPDMPNSQVHRRRARDSR